MMLSSMDLMLTGSSMMPRVQEPSHGAGQTRPVNSGKLLVFSSLLKASCHCPLRTRSFHSGMRLPSGQPDLSVTLWWQKGVPQSMQREAWVWTSVSSFLARISLKSPTRSLTVRFGRSPRSSSTKPRRLFATTPASSSFFGRLPFMKLPQSSMSRPELTGAAILPVKLTCRFVANLCFFSFSSVFSGRKVLSLHRMSSPFSRACTIAPM
mmetsp:Transcript_84340/g.217206  ORF Transcript_84340/g.217206 Transcript_84340/m.217206 type:complete len:209 (+) Transcript_84340:473-1099(+)